MPKKCESCIHYKAHPFVDSFERGWCTHVKIRRLTIYDQPGTPRRIEEAREICDREHDGHFVYFEPVQITRTIDDVAREDFGYPDLRKEAANA